MSCHEWLCPWILRVIPLYEAVQFLVDQSDRECLILSLLKISFLKYLRTHIVDFTPPVDSSLLASDPQDFSVTVSSCTPRSSTHLLALKPAAASIESCAGHTLATAAVHLKPTT